MPKGAGGLPQIFFHPKSYFFVTIHSVQDCKTVTQPLLGEKCVVVVVVGGWWWLTVILVFCFGPNLFLALQDLSLDRAEQ